MEASWEMSGKRAAELIKNANLLHRRSTLLGDEHGHYIFFTETEEGKDDGPVLCVKGEQFKWAEYGSKEAMELRRGEREEKPPESVPE